MLTDSVLFIYPFISVSLAVVWLVHQVHLISNIWFILTLLFTMEAVSVYLFFHMTTESPVVKFLFHVTCSDKDSFFLMLFHHLWFWILLVRVLNIDSTLTSCWTFKRKTFYLFENTFLVQHALYTYMQKYKSSPRLLCFLFMIDGWPTM